MPFAIGSWVRRGFTRGSDGLILRYACLVRIRRGLRNGQAAHVSRRPARRDGLGFGLDPFQSLTDGFHMVWQTDWITDENREWLPDFRFRFGVSCVGQPEYATKAESRNRT